MASHKETPAEKRLRLLEVFVGFAREPLKFDRLKPEGVFRIVKVNSATTQNGLAVNEKVDDG